MHLDELNYTLPEHLIAQTPPARRSAGRLLVAARDGSREAEHTTFPHLPDYLHDGDVLVVNRSRVVPARLVATRADGLAVEVLFVRAIDDAHFLAWARPMRKLKAGDELRLPGGAMVTFAGRRGEREGEFELRGDDAGILHALETDGHVPLPPYIHRDDTRDDRERYQTVYAREPGSVAAPTAGRHYDDAMLDAVRARGERVHSLLLHAGPGTFQPLEHDVLEANRLHAESVSIDADTIAAVTAARAERRRVVAVGTTACRALETAGARGWLDMPPDRRGGETDLFIRPGYRFGVVDALLTNFHLPRSSLLALVCAFADTGRVLALYRDAVAREYRFFSYGDAMFIA
jgi:S-adenosylmethionine:tRNA ribosyltransferase-isomerase